MKFVATLTKAKALEPGDLFSTGGPEYWEQRDPLAIGEKVYVRTDAACPEDQREVDIYRIEVQP